MKLLSIELQNFRQFHGRQRLELATDDDANVTVVHGFNGSGKTALLNAFEWCLYGETSGEREASERLASERAVVETVPGDPVTVGVTLALERDGERYVVDRHRTGLRGDSPQLRFDLDDDFDGSADFDVTRITESGEEETLDDPERWVEQLWPRPLRHFFFLEGESIEEMASPQSFEAIETGVRTLLDVELFQRSCTHLRRHVSSELRRALRSLTEAGEDEEALEAEHALTEEIERLADDLDGIRANIATLDERIAEHRTRLRGANEHERLTVRREELERQLHDLNDDLGFVQDDLGRLAVNHGALLLLADGYAQAESLLDDHGAPNDDGTPNLDVDVELIDQLLDASTCLCGRRVRPGSPERHALEDWRRQEAPDVPPDAIERLRRAVSGRSGHAAYWRSKLEHQLKKRDTLLERREALQSELEELGATVERTPPPESLQDELDVMLQDRTDLQGERRGVAIELSNKRKALEALQKEIAEAREESEQAARLRRQKAAVDRLSDTLEAIADIRQDVVRAELDEQVREVWERTAIKGYTARLTDDYQLVLSKRVGDKALDVRGLSTGEKQVLALSWVASLVSQARRNAELERETLGGELGGIYPLILDSPFGALEDAYRRSVAEWIPTLANQVVLLVSHAQWREEVESGIAPKIGRSWVLELHTPKPDSDLEIDVGGESVPYVVTDTVEGEWTRIRDVSNHGGTT